LTSIASSILAALETDEYFIGGCDPKSAFITSFYVVLPTEMFPSSAKVIVGRSGIKLNFLV
jgi:hypothetical protein